jgi:hypothetical protein
MRNSAILSLVAGGALACTHADSRRSPDFTQTCVRIDEIVPAPQAPGSVYPDAFKHPETDGILSLARFEIEQAMKLEPGLDFCLVEDDRDPIYIRLSPKGSYHSEGLAVDSGIDIQVPPSLGVVYQLGPFYVRPCGGKVTAWFDYNPANDYATTALNHFGDTLDCIEGRFH